MLIRENDAWWSRWSPRDDALVSKLGDFLNTKQRCDPWQRVPHHYWRLPTKGMQKLLKSYNRSLWSWLNAWCSRLECIHQMRESIKWSVSWWRHNFAKFSTKLKMSICSNKRCKNSSLILVMRTLLKPWKSLVSPSGDPHSWTIKLQDRSQAQGLNRSLRVAWPRDIINSSSDIILIILHTFRW